MGKKYIKSPYRDANLRAQEVVGTRPVRTIKKKIKKDGK